MANIPSAQQDIQHMAREIREQLADPDEAGKIVGSVMLGTLVQMAGLDELADRDELLGWLASTADAIRDNPELREQMREQGAILAQDAEDVLLGLDSDD